MPHLYSRQSIAHLAMEQKPAVVDAQVTYAPNVRVLRRSLAFCHPAKTVLSLELSLS
jgi:hypothetical protein